MPSPLLIIVGILIAMVLFSGLAWALLAAAARADRWHTHTAERADPTVAKTDDHAPGSRHTVRRHATGERAAKRAPGRHR